MKLVRFIAATKRMKTKQSQNIASYLFLMQAMVFWGLSFVWYKQALIVFKPVTLVVLRLLISLPLLFVMAILFKRLKKVHRKDVPIFLLLAFFEPFLYFLCESHGMLYVSSTVASILIATIPLFTSIIAYFFLHEKLKAFNYIGMILSFGGVLLVIFSDGIYIGANIKGIAIMMGAVMSAILYGFIIKKIADRYNTLTIVTVQNLIASIYFLPVFLVLDFRDMQIQALNLESLLPLLYLAVFSSTFAYVGFIQGIKKLGVAKATIFTNFIPVFTAVSAFLLLGELISGLKVAGIVLVVLGLIMAQRSGTIKNKKSGDVIVNELY